MSEIDNLYYISQINTIPIFLVLLFTMILLIDLLMDVLTGFL
jgi:hypothetical protein